MNQKHFCTLCGQPITPIAQERMRGGIIVMLTCFNKLCRAYTCTTTDDAVADGSFHKLWTFVTEFDAQTGARL